MHPAQDALLNQNTWHAGKVRLSTVTAQFRTTSATAGPQAHSTEHRIQGRQVPGELRRLHGEPDFLTSESLHVNDPSLLIKQ